MSEEQMKFRVGLFVLLSLGVGIGLVFQFGKLNRYFEPRYQIAIQFDRLSGVLPGTPVLQSGLPIGEVLDVSIHQKQRKVIVIAEIRETVKLPVDAQAKVVSSLLGESHLEFGMGSSADMIRPGAMVKGIVPGNPLEAVERLEQQVNTTLRAFAETSMEWKRVGSNVNSLVETNQGSMDQIMDQAAIALKELTLTMRNASQTLEQANEFVADPEMQMAVKQMMQNLPRLMQHTERLIQKTEETIATTNTAVTSLGSTMQNLDRATAPLAANSEVMVAKFDNGMTLFNQTLFELKRFAALINEEDGTLQRLAKDPQLYRNLQSSSASLAVLLSNLTPVLQDVRVFSDKVARHPELLGVSGYLKGSNGLKESPIQPASASAPANLSGESYSRPNASGIYMPAPQR